ncbi:alpha-E domain-containing protein [Tamlana sp. 2_MG-2023]|uniref:alpha-E domain-containing protein n=1 Tax=unclassified Tamlana TaxID=2614803 RepID=UPI0026E20CC6|nr:MULTISPECIES: alpha-E domain-containing protein [unclassified Tamlana]MDO6760748.1 alpha-E domain-containing protein [Tamlana sp. 2_MG-2023]MDO6791004.1 alpha-E domain-containing protein [Tamlana sp. 1_MG-2023]
MLSRVANNLIWLERYMERGNGILSLLKVNFYANQDSPELFPWTPIIKNYTDYNNTFYTENTVECLDFMIFNRDNANSILNIVTRARENARSVQEHISRELWICVNNYYLFLTKKGLRKKLKNEDPIEFLDNLRNYHLMFYGIMDITQERGAPYYFLNLGKFLERMILVSDFTELKLTEIAKTTDKLEQSFYWKNLLLSMGGYQLYLKKYKSAFKEDHIISMVFQEKLFPRSLYYCVNKLNLSVGKLIEGGQLDKNYIEFSLGKLESTIKYTTIESINKQGLEHFINEIKQDIHDISKSINKIYFSEIT